MTHSLRSIRVLAIALATVLLGAGGAMAGDFQNLHGNIPNPGCISVHSSPRNVSTAMAMATYEFVSPAADNYRCCISSNTSGQDLFVRLIGLTGSQLAFFQTPVNGTGCTPFVGLGGGFAFQCTVASGAGSPVGGAAHYVLGACRQ